MKKHSVMIWLGVFLALGSGTARAQELAEITFTQALPGEPTSPPISWVPVPVDLPPFQTALGTLVEQRIDLWVSGSMSRSYVNRENFPITLAVNPRVTGRWYDDATPPSSCGSPQCPGTTSWLGEPTLVPLAANPTFLAPCPPLVEPWNATVGFSFDVTLTWPLPLASQIHVGGTHRIDVDSIPIHQCVDCPPSDPHAGIPCGDQMASYAGTISVTYTFVPGWPVIPPEWADLGNALAGTHGEPSLIGAGTLLPESIVTLVLSNALESAQSALVVGFDTLYAPFKGGVMVPSLDLLLFTPTSDIGDIVLSTTWPSGVPSGFTMVFQYWITDVAGPAGYAASNAISGTVP